MSEQMTQTPLVKLAPLRDQNTLKRALLAHLNSWPEKPVALIQYEALPPDGAGMALLSTGQGAYIVGRWITGGYEGAYDFLLAYRIQPGDSPDARLAADETLDTLADWLCAGPWPALGEKARITRIECLSRSVVTGEDRENGVEDHVVSMKLTYEVN